MMHFEAAVARTVEAVLFGERSQEACADSPILDRRVVEEIDPDGRTGAVLGHRQEPRAEVARICTGVLRPVVDAVLPMSAAQEAHARLEAGDSFGKIVLAW